MIKLYQAVPSANTERVRIALYEKGLSYTPVTLDLNRNEHKSLDFLKLNPYGKVPVLEDDGRVLFESCIINEYLEDRYPEPPLMPKDPYLRARGRILVDYALNYLLDAYWKLRSEMLKKQLERDRAVVRNMSQLLIEQAQYLEDALGRREWFLGDFSLVDIDLWPRLSKMETFGALPPESLPSLQAWVCRMKERPSVRLL